jgi:hypothetical protein
MTKDYDLLKWQLINHITEEASEYSWVKAADIAEVFDIPKGVVLAILRVCIDEQHIRLSPLMCEEGFMRGMGYAPANF